MAVAFMAVPRVAAQGWQRPGALAKHRVVE